MTRREAMLASRFWSRFRAEWLIVHKDDVPREYPGKSEYREENRTSGAEAYISLASGTGTGPSYADDDWVSRFARTGEEG